MKTVEPLETLKTAENGAPAADLRFDGIARLYGDAAFERLRAAHVGVIGVGGVGSWTVEALARSGIGALTMVDLDDVCASNINRQVPALTSTVGQFKVDVLAERIHAIHPTCRVYARREFLTESNAEALATSGPDVWVDAIDSARLKALFAVVCRQHRQPLVLVGGSGGRVDPTRVRIDDLARTRNDPLLHRVRKTLRMQYGFPRGTKKFGIDAIWTEELPRFVDSAGETCAQPGEAFKPTRINCANGYGAASFVTGAFGFAAAAAAIRRLLAAP